MVYGNQYESKLTFACIKFLLIKT